MNDLLAKNGSSKFDFIQSNKVKSFQMIWTALTKKDDWICDVLIHSHQKVAT